MTLTVEFSNIVFSAIFAIEMLLKIIAEGPLNYVGNGFNVFDGVIVILRWVEDVVLFTSTLYCDDAENALFIHASYIDRIDRFPPF